MSFYKKIIYSLFLIFAFANLSYADNDITNSKQITMIKESNDVATVSSLVDRFEVSIILTGENIDKNDNISNYLFKQGFNLTVITLKNGDFDLQQIKITGSNSYISKDELIKMIKGGVKLSVTLTGENINTEKINSLIREGFKLSVPLTAENNHLASIRNLIQQDFLLDARNKFGFEALMKAILGRDVTVVKALIEGGVDVNALTKNGDIPLFLATLYGPLEIVKLLVEANADVQYTHEGRSALGIARNSQRLAVYQSSQAYEEITKFLVDEISKSSNSCKRAVQSI